MSGEDVAQIKDTVYVSGGGAVQGFTLAGRGIFSGPMKPVLAWSSVLALGADAVMISDKTALETAQLLDDPAADDSGGDVLGSQVLTDSGVDLGTVVDVVLQVGDSADGQCAVVGYEIEASEALGPKGTRMLMPLPDTLAVSGQHLMVPAAAKDFVAQDLAGFGAAVLAFRAQLDGGR